VRVERGNRWLATRKRPPRPRYSPSVECIVPAFGLNEHLAATQVRNFIFETLDGEPGALDYVVGDMIRPDLAEAGIPWHGLHAFRRGLATNLHELGVADSASPTL
jgi:hypothetical protein